jgi:hypothetical protein
LHRYSLWTAIFKPKPINFLKALQSNAFKKFIGLGLSAKRCKMRRSGSAFFYMFLHCYTINTIIFQKHLKPKCEELELT